MKVEQTEPSFPEGDELLDRVDARITRLCRFRQRPSAALIERTGGMMDRRMRRESETRRPFFLRPAFLSMAAAIAILSASVAVYRTAFHHQPPGVVKTDVEIRQLIRFVSSRRAYRRMRLPAHIEPPTPAPIAHEPAPHAPVDVVYASGVITGRVLFDGVPPTPAPLPGVNLMPECQKAHGGPIYDESVVVNPDGTLANVVVSVSAGLSGWLREEFPPPPAQAVLDQKGCVFEPHVIALMVGEPLLIRNSDPFLHNVHVMAVNNPQANLGQPTVGETATEPFESPEVFRVKCDVHPWMQAWVRVVDNPFFAVTGRDGRFTLNGLPPGTYTLKAWHEKLGVREMQVTDQPDRKARRSVSRSKPLAMVVRNAVPIAKIVVYRDLSSLEHSGRIYVGRCTGKILRSTSG